MPAVILLISLAFIVSCTTRPSHRTAENSPVLTVAAASDLMPVFSEMREKLRLPESGEIVFSFGSSGALTRQVEEGAPFDILATASDSYIQRVKAEGLSLPGTEIIFARGRLVLWSGSDSEPKISNLNDLTLPAVKRIAIANPEFAPYGKAAEEVLRSVSLWDSVHDKLVFGENVIQAFQFAKTGNVDAALISCSLVPLSDRKAISVDSRLHSPINQSVCILRRTQAESSAREFINTLGSTAGKSVLEKYGFQPLTQFIP